MHRRRSFFWREGELTTRGSRASAERGAKRIESDSSAVDRPYAFGELERLACSLRIALAPIDVLLC